MYLGDGIFLAVNGTMYNLQKNLQKPNLTENYLNFSLGGV